LSAATDGSAARARVRLNRVIASATAILLMRAENLCITPPLRPTAAAFYTTKNGNASHLIDAAIAASETFVNT
jgi:hypothetical protein